MPQDRPLVIDAAFWNDTRSLVLSPSDHNFWIPSYAHRFYVLDPIWSKKSMKISALRALLPPPSYPVQSEQSRGGGSQHAPLCLDGDDHFLPLKLDLTA